MNLWGWQLARRRKMADMEGVQPQWIKLVGPHGDNLMAAHVLISGDCHTAFVAAHMIPPHIITVASNRINHFRPRRVERAAVGPP